MEYKRTLNNFVLIKLDRENTSVKLKNGIELYLDTSFEPEKHATITGTIYGLPSHLIYTGKPNLGMPWLTPMEIEFGDKVIIYYLSVVNALRKEKENYFLEGGDRYIMIEYQYIFAVVREDKIIPINGYVLVEPIEDPALEKEKLRMAFIGMKAVFFKKKTQTQVTYGIVKYVGVPNREYADENLTDEGVDIGIGDTVVLRRTVDIPLQYELHATVDKGKGLLRVQRRNVLAKI